ncbi:N-acetylmuramic acid-6-phosphate etherase [Aureimonas ureilytica]|uniref:N-acetylmuramic acid-6-phosphate etherase n=1 Tax=Aureimonas ureilytica TaxID=401562 RepID=A0A175REH1_9HYPH|nr:N-acetylmuramic acid 6-phosphate etherase [Aureimonas ureilytica]KTQ98573.1 N-acetylmuramic acid-6-phosphate etherase [Aureimonas ureilytica]
MTLPATPPLSDPSLPETERADPRFSDLETRPTSALLEVLLGGHTKALVSVAAALPDIERAADAVAARLGRDRESRLVYCGAGTSGRLALQDGVELGPTFDWPPERAVFLLAGGVTSLALAREGAEDDEASAAAMIAEAGLCGRDVVIGVAASGRTPFTLACIAKARERGALTIAFANEPSGPLLRAAEIGILLRTGPEVLAGSTRMAAGTAQKIALNLLSTAVMIRLGKVFRGRMVEMRPTNDKLRARAERMVADVAGCGLDRAREALDATGGRIREAILRAEADNLQE